LGPISTLAGQCSADPVRLAVDLPALWLACLTVHHALGPLHALQHQELSVRICRGWCKHTVPATGEKLVARW
jgi:hypothetical protein